MSADEILITWVGVFTAAVTWGRWYWVILRLPRLGARSGARNILMYAPLLSFALLFAVLRAGGSFDVRDSTPYLFMYMMMGAAWTGLAMLFSGWYGIGLRNDAIERDNAGAAIALGGAIVGVMFCFAGGNIGDGPGWWVVVFCAALATLSLALIWRILEARGAVAEQVTVERDVAAAIRVAGFLAACGILLGRAVAGDWVSAEATFIDFGRAAWPALVLLLVAVVMERRLSVSVERPVADTTSAGVVPALVYAVLAIAWVFTFGRIV